MKESKHYRFARVEGYRITRARLEQQFNDRAVNLEEVEAAVAAQLSAKTLCTPWRTSEIERAGCREGMRVAALEFLCEYGQVLRMAGQCHSA